MGAYKENNLIIRTERRHFRSETIFRPEVRAIENTLLLLLPVRKLQPLFEFN